MSQVISDAGFPIGQALMAGGRLYLLARDSSSVAVLNPAAAPDAPRWRRLALGPPQPPGKGLWQLMTAPTPVGPVLALNPLNGLVSEIDAPEALGNAPQMTGFALRGGQPIALATLTRSWRDTATPGTLATRLALPAGNHEIVVTAGIGLTLCLPLSVNGPTDTAPTATLHLTAPPGATLSFRLETTGAAPPSNTETRITIAAIGSGWRQTAMATPDASGIYTLTVALPGPGLYAATPDLPGLDARATTFQVPECASSSLFLLATPALAEPQRIAIPDVILTDQTGTELRLKDTNRARRPLVHVHHLRHAVPRHQRHPGRA